MSLVATRCPTHNFVGKRGHSKCRAHRSETHTGPYRKTVLSAPALSSPAESLPKAPGETLAPDIRTTPAFLMKWSLYSAVGTSFDNY
ncbi:hypothetical protein CEXT_583791 [Caerostris extrusa]|uniref:Uncharacterized protein n=1 Tax=Caerostris extrusa TaxID=172846 RepID=A0AAV4VIM7_CAEEX|nr:hypothetical protein CEXT_583791 [Caerostris extrusa]